MKYFGRKKADNHPGIPKPGIYQYLREFGDNRKRIHLRVESDGSGVLIVNASRMYHFNPSAAFMAFSLLNEIHDSDAVKQIEAVFDVKHEQAVSDFDDFKSSLEKIISPLQDPCPVCDMEIDTFSPFSREPSAPYRMDLALTYRCNNRCVHCYNEPSRAQDEFMTDEWKRALDKIWETAVPHVVFTGGEPTLRNDLPYLIAYAENLGLITGLNTNGRRLSDISYLEGLRAAGLDHIQITLESHLSFIHDRIVASSGAWEETVAGIRNALETGLFVMTNTTMLRENSPYLKETLEFLASLKVPTVGLNGLIYSGRGAKVSLGITESDLSGLLDIAREHVSHSGQRLIWYTPTMYCHFNPLDSGLGVKGCTAALYNMCVEPDGFVLPCQSYYQPLGHILKDGWDTIWRHDLAVAIRERSYAPADCHACDLLNTCGAGCPLYIRENTEVKPQPVNALPF